jgi:hypothetical protein
MGTNSRLEEKVFIYFFFIKLRESVVQKKKKENNEYSSEKEPLRNKSYFSFKELCYQEINIKTKLDMDVIKKITYPKSGVYAIKFCWWTTFNNN